MTFGLMERYVQSVFPRATVGRRYEYDGTISWEVNVKCADTTFSAPGIGEPDSRAADWALHVLRMAMLRHEARGLIASSDIAAALGLP